MANESTYELSPEEMGGNSSVGYLVFNGRPDEGADPLTSPDFKIIIRASTEDEAVNDLRIAGWKDCKSAKLEKWKFHVSGVNDHAIEKVWVPQAMSDSGSDRWMKVKERQHPAFSRVEPKRLEELVADASLFAAAIARSTFSYQGV